MDCAIASEEVADVSEVELKFIVTVPVRHPVVEGRAIYQAVEDALDCADLL